MFLILFRNILCLQQMFRSLRSPGNIMSNIVSSFASAFRMPIEKSCDEFLTSGKRQYRCVCYFDSNCVEMGVQAIDMD